MPQPRKVWAGRGTIRPESAEIIDSVNRKRPRTRAAVKRQSLGFFVTGWVAFGGSELDETEFPEPVEFGRRHGLRKP